MSGGVAYVYDPRSELPKRCNPDVEGDLLPVEDGKVRWRVPQHAS
jgi:glutamate synthase domain-containing protein 3